MRSLSTYIRVLRVKNDPEASNQMRSNDGPWSEMPDRTTLTRRAGPIYFPNLLGAPSRPYLDAKPEHQHEPYLDRHNGRNRKQRNVEEECCHAGKEQDTARDQKQAYDHNI